MLSNMAEPRSILKKKRNILSPFKRYILTFLPQGKLFVEEMPNFCDNFLKILFIF